MSRAPEILGRFALMLALAAPLYLAVYRPMQLRWGATDAEVARRLPGDEIQPTPMFDATRAVSIDAPPERIWPWLLQWGYHRAGLYSALDWVDNGGVPSADHLIPELQHLEVGDRLPIAEADVPMAGIPEIYNRVLAVEPNRHTLSKASDSGESWLWWLEPVNARQTRLLWRMRWAPYDWTSPSIGLKLLTDLGDFVLVRNLLLGIKERAEGRPIESLAATTPQVALGCVPFAALLASLALLVLRRDWLRPPAAAAGTYPLPLGLVFGMPPLWVDAAAALGTVGGLWWLYRAELPGGPRSRGHVRRRRPRATSSASRPGVAWRAQDTSDPVAYCLARHAPPVLLTWAPPAGGSGR